MKINSHYSALPAHYLFHDIDLRVQNYLSQHPDARLLRMGIGDVTRPLPRVIVDAMQRAAEELAHEETFRGYCPENGYEWLRQTIIDHFFLPRGIHFDAEEIFISEGAGSDLGNLSDLFDRDNKVAIMDPTYPAYVDANIMAGREITLLPCLKENNFVPDLPAQPVDIIYLCFPIIPQEPFSRAINSACGWTTLIATTPLSSSTPRTKPIFLRPTSRILSTRSKAHGKWQSRCIVSVRVPASRPSAAAMWSCLLRQDFNRYGCVGNVPNTTEPPMSPNAPRRLLSPPKGKKAFAKT